MAKRASAKDLILDPVFNNNPIAFIHDVGAGGLSNALPELVKDGGVGGAV